MYYYRARYYDPEIGRFISADPLTWAPNDPRPRGYVRQDPVYMLRRANADSGIDSLVKDVVLSNIVRGVINNRGALNPSQFHLYTYVDNNPVNWTDPWGLQDEGQTWEEWESEEGESGEGGSWTEGETAWVEDFNPKQPGWRDNTTDPGWDCVIDDTGRIEVVDSNPGWGHVYSPLQEIDIDEYPILTINIQSVDSGADFSLEVQDFFGPVETFVQFGTRPGIYTVNMADLMNWTGTHRFYVSIWVGNGLGRSIQVDWIKIHALAGPQVVEFAYDGLGRRISKGVNGASTRYIYDRHNVIEEYSNNQLQRSNIFSLNIDEILQTIISQANYYYNHDHLGSVTEITDGTGNIIEKYEYDPFGNPQIIGPATGSLRKESIIGNRYMFTAREWDQETQLYYYRARYYDSSIGRFLSQDPILSLYRYKSKFYNYVPILMHLPQTLNPYLYVGNNPLNKIDPGGLAAQTPGCDGVPDWMEKLFLHMKKCCDDHDDCYLKNNCSIQSWAETVDPKANKDCNPDKSKECEECNKRVLACFKGGS